MAAMLSDFRNLCWLLRAPATVWPNGCVCVCAVVCGITTIISELNFGLIYKRWRSIRFVGCYLCFQWLVVEPAEDVAMVNVYIKLLYSLQFQEHRPTDY